MNNSQGDSPSVLCTERKAVVSNEEYEMNQGDMSSEELCCDEGTCQIVRSGTSDRCPQSSCDRQAEEDDLTEAEHVDGMPVDKTRVDCLGRPIRRGSKAHSIVFADEVGSTHIAKVHEVTSYKAHYQRSRGRYLRSCAIQ